MKTYKVPIPPDFQFAEPLQEDKEIEVLAKLKLTKDGKFEILTFNGATVFDVEHEKKKAEEELKKIQEAEEAADEYEKETAEPTPAALTDEVSFMDAVMKDGRVEEAFA